MFLHHLFCHSDIFYSIMKYERGDTSEMEEQIDPRWNELKKILDNN